jgi:hypothetical protein
MTVTPRPWPSLSAAVMTHPRRLRHARALVERHPELDLRLVVDPEPEGPPTALRSASAAWGAVDADASHHLVVQDDVTLSAGFLPRVLAAVRSQPEGALSLFTHWGSHLSYAVRLAALGGLSWTGAIGTYLPTVALVLPAEVARAVAGRLAGAGTRHDDVAMRRVLADLGVPAYVAVRNLVQDNDLPSLVGHAAHGVRRAACFLTPDPRAAGSRGPEPDADVWTSDGPEPDADVWTGASLRPRLLPYVDAVTGRARCCRWDEADRMRGSRTPIDRELADFGCPPHLLRDSLAEHLARTAPEGRQLRDIDPDPLLAVWSAAHLLGVATTVHPAMRASDRAIPRAGGTAGAALGTLGPGALRLQVPMERLRAARTALAELVHTGVRAGRARALSAARDHTWR